MFNRIILQGELVPYSGTDKCCNVCAPQSEDFSKSTIKELMMIRMVAKVGKRISPQVSVT